MNAVKNDAQAHESGARANPDVSGLRRRDRKIRYIAVDEIAPNPMQPRADSTTSRSTRFRKASAATALSSRSR